MNKIKTIPPNPDQNINNIPDIDDIPELNPDNIKLIENSSDVLSPEEAENQLEMREILEIKFAGSSEASQKHPDRNEDAFFTNAENASAGVFDGLGGYKGGDIASKIARETIELEMAELPKNISLEDLQQKMSDMIKKASNEIMIQAKKAKLEKIGTTASVIKFWENENGERKAVIANVGDSRVYRFKNNKLEAITEDDSIMKRLMENGVIKNDNPNQIIKGQDVIDTGLLSAEDAKQLNPNMDISIESIRRMMGQALGVHENNNKNLKPNILTIDIKDGDILLLSTDGIHDNLTDEQIERLLKTEGTEKDISEEIVRQADLVVADSNNPRSKEDDKTAVIIKI